MFRYFRKNLLLKTIWEVSTSSKSKYVSRRALLYMPGDKEKMLKKIPSLNVDCCCMDLEDAVAANAKDTARNYIVKTLDSIDFGSKDVAVRINPVVSPYIERDFEAVFSAKQLPSSIVIPKVNSAMEIEYVSQRLDCIDKSNSVQIIAQIESASSVLNLSSILTPTSKRLDALIIGGDDIAASVGLIRTRSNLELLLARQSVVLHARMHSLQAIDIVNIHVSDTDRLKLESIEGRTFGYTGKQIIHPSQIDTVQDAFTPTPEEIDYSRRIIIQFLENEKAGAGAFLLDGKMIDMPTVLQARKCLYVARMAGIAIDANLL